MKQIMAVCIGNICRSPIAEALLKQQFPDKTIWSAGLGALVGNPADPMAVEAAAARGVDISAHRAQQLTSWMCQSADLILVMETAHKAELEQLYPTVRGKVFRLGQIGDFEISDPYRLPQSAFETAYTDIARGVEAWAPRIRQLS